MQTRRPRVQPIRSVPTGEPLGSQSWTEQFFGVDPDDPALGHITRALGQLKFRFGFDTSDPQVRARAVEAGRRDYAAEQRRTAEWWRDRPERVDVVYYLRMGKLIKIGTTGCLADRLRAYPPDATLLATEPGDRTVEKQRHHQFRETLAERHEWFHPSVELIAHINSLREQPLTAAELAA